MLWLILKGKKMVVIKDHPLYNPIGVWMERTKYCKLFKYGRI